MQATEGVRQAQPFPKVDSGDIVYRLAIVLLPFVLLAINDNWIFSKPLFVDRWLYSGLHLHLPLFLKAFGDTYYASRLPWTVIGWLLHSTFDDATALYILHFAVFYLAVFSLYAAIRTLFANAAAACAAAFVLGTHTYFLAAVGWDYVDGAALSCMLAAIAALASASVRPRWRLAAFLWGVAACAMVSLYILLVLLVPVQIGMFLLLNRLRGNRPVLPAAIWFAVGGVAAMLFFGLLNWLLGGPFLYLLNQISVLATVAHNRYNYYEPFVDWALGANWLLVIAITFTFSCAYVGLRFKSVAKKIRLGDLGADPEISLFVCCLADIAASLIFGGLQLDHFYVLQMVYNSSALLPFAYLTIGSALAVVVKPSGRTQQFGFLAAVALITLVPWMLANLGYVFPHEHLFDSLTLELGWILTGALLLVFVVLRSYRLVGAALLISFLSIVNLGAPAGGIDYPREAAFKPEILSVFDASRALTRYNADARARFWFSRNDPQDQILRSVVATYFWYFRLVNDQFPNLVSAAGPQSSVMPGDRIVLMTSRGDDPIGLANAAVADRNLLFEQVAKIEIRRPGVAFTMFVTDVKIDPKALARARSLSPAAMTLAPHAASLHPTASGVAFRSAPDPWSNIGRMLLLAGCIEGGGWVAVNVRVTRGTIGVGVLNRKGDTFLVSGSVAASDDIQTVFLRLDSFAATGDLILRNWDKNSSSEGSFQGALIAADNGLTPAACDPDPARTKAMAEARSLSLKTLTRASRGVSWKRSESEVAFRSAPEPWSDIGRMPLLAGCIEGGGWVAADIRVTHGAVGVGVLNRRGDDLLTSGSAATGDNIQTIFLRLGSFSAAGDLLIRNWDDNTSSEGSIQGVRIAAEAGPTPATCDPDPARTKAMAQARALSLETMTLASPGGSLQPTASGVAFRSAPEPWSYIGRMPLLAGCIEGGGWVAADIRVTRGTIGVGVLNRKGDAFLVSESVAFSDDIQTVFLPLDSFAAAGDLIVRNWDEKLSSEGVVQGARIASRGGQTPVACGSDAVRVAALAHTRSHPGRDLSGPTTVLPLESLRPQNGAGLSADDGSIVLTTPAQQWAYAASAPIALPLRAAGRGVVRVRLQVEEGKLGIGVLALDHASDMLAEQAADVTDAPIDLDIDLADVANARSIVLRSWSSNGVRTRARILLIETVLEHDPRPAAAQP
jgi:hypothetical protein